jgi:hypothetical protein
MSHAQSFTPYLGNFEQVLSAEVILLWLDRNILYLLIPVALWVLLFSKGIGIRIVVLLWGAFCFLYVFLEKYEEKYLKEKQDTIEFKEKTIATLRIFA